MTAPTTAIPIDLDLDSEQLVEQAERLDLMISSGAGSSAHYTWSEWGCALEQILDLLKSRGAPEVLTQRIARLIAVNRELNLIPDDQFINTHIKAIRWAKIDAQLREQGVESVILLGAGKHTRWLLSFWSASDRISIRCLVDDYSDADSVDGIPVIRPSQLENYLTPGCVVLPSSDSYEQALLDQTRPLSKSLGFELWSVYTNPSLQSDIDELGASKPSPSISAIDTSTSSELNPAPKHRQSLGLQSVRLWLPRFQELPGLVDWATGYMNDYDAAFTWDIIEASASIHADAFTVVEIGTASGVSTSRIAQGLDELVSRPWQLHTFDLDVRCYFDASYAVGEAANQLAPLLLDRIHIHTQQNATHAARRFSPGEVQLAVIDADHSHPAPARDLLALLPILAPRAWVILHDIELDSIMEKQEHSPDEHNGPSRLFHAYPGVKAREATDIQTDSNTGAIQMPDDPLSLRPMLLDLIASRA